MTRRGFSLIEMLVATALASVLMGGLLFALTGVSRDRRALAAPARPAVGIVELIRWDLTNARTIADQNDIVLTGVDGIDPASLEPNGRLVRVTYRVESDKSLWRIQRYLDDPAGSHEWREIVATDVSAFSIGPASAGPTPVPGHPRLQLAMPGQSIDQALDIK